MFLLDDGWPRPGAPPSFLERLLLTTDGTVVKILEAYVGELIEVVKLDQEVVSQGGHDELQMLGPEPIILRNVLLRSARSGTNLVYAESLTRAGNVPVALRHDLLSTDKAIGHIFMEQHAETFREILATGHEPAGSRSSHFGIAPEDPLLFRRYRVTMGGLHVMLITEMFPAGAFGA